MKKRVMDNMKELLCIVAVRFLIPIGILSIVGILYYFKYYVLMYVFVLTLTITFLIVAILIASGKYQTVFSRFWKDVLVAGSIERKHHKTWGLVLIVVSLLFIIAFLYLGAGMLEWV
jgi:hypothetical protein